MTKAGMLQALYTNRELLQEHIKQFNKDPNMPYDTDTGKGYEDSNCATQPMSSAAIEHEKITINKAEYDDLRKSLTEWQTMASLSGVDKARYSAVPGPTEVYAAIARGRQDVAQVQLKLGERIQEIMHKNAEISDLTKQRNAAIEREVEAMKRSKAKTRKRSK